MPTKKTTSKPGTRKSTASRRTATASTNSQTASAARAIESKPTSAGAAITRQAIAEAAYYLWLQRGGDEVTNWLDAERLLAGRSPVR